MNTRITVREAARRAGVCPALVDHWCAEHLLPHYRIGGKGRRGKIVIDETDLEAFLQRFRVEAQTHEEPKSAPRPRTPALKHLSLS